LRDYWPVGPGLQLGWDTRSRRVRVISPVKDSPAHRAGVHAGDVITHIVQEGDDEDPCRVQVLSTRGWSVAEVAKKLLGKPGTRVRFTVRREGVSKPLEFEVVRAPVELETVLGHHRRHDDNWDYLIDPVHRIGYVRLTAFDRNTARDLRRVLGRLNRVGLKGLILDLRFHPGGLLDTGIKVANLFVEEGLLLSIRPGAGREARFEAQPQDRLVRCPVVCLVNGATTRVSEAVAACLQDHRRALIVGERSRGEGGIWNIQPAKHRDLKLTTAVLLRPSGQKLDRIRMPGHGADEWGVTPDPGFDLPLPARERAALHQHLDSLTVIPWCPPAKGAGFTDRQLTLALAYLQSRSG
jgi:carboxyl-terminal processing protease